MPPAAASTHAPRHDPASRPLHPGQPAIVVQNMEGAAGIVSVNHLSRAPRGSGRPDAGRPGRSWFIEAIVKRPGIAFDPTRSPISAAPAPPRPAAYHPQEHRDHHLRPAQGVNQAVTFGALGVTTPTAMSPALLAAAGAPVRVVLGYVSTARVNLALEQGEVRRLPSRSATRSSQRKALAERLTPVVQTATPSRACRISPT